MAEGTITENSADQTNVEEMKSDQQQVSVTSTTEEASNVESKSVQQHSDLSEADKVSDTEAKTVDQNNQK